MQLLKELLKKGLYYSGYYRLYARSHAPVENRLLVIMYHDLVEDDTVATDWSRWGKPTRSQFAAHVEFLQRHYRVLTVEQAVEEIKSDGRLTQPTVAITFDDGYDSVYHIAWPILKEHGATATVYLLTDWINRKMTPWWLTLNGVIKKLDLQKLCVADIENDLGMRFQPKIKTISHEAKLKWALYTEIEAYFINKPDETVKGLLDRLNALAGGSVPQEISPLNWEQIAEMAAAGMQFGGHTRSHINIRHADSRATAREIIESKKEIEKRLPGKIKGFAYPYGNDLAAYAKIKPILEQEGFTYAVTATPGNNDQTAEAFQLRRITLPTTTSPALLGRCLTLDYLTRNIGSDTE